MLTRALFTAALVSPLLLAACSGPVADSPEAAGPAEYAVVDGWVRNPPGGRDVTAGFITVTAGAAGGQLVGATTDEAETVEIHTMAMEGDVMRMRRVDAIDIPAGGAASLAPGGDHLMIFGVDPAQLEDGEMDLVLTFADGQTLPVTLPVSDTAPDLNPDSGAMGHEGH